jgi:hypothetical protein
MGIQEILTYMGPVDNGSSGQRGISTGKQKGGDVPESELDRYTVSGQARAMYEAGVTRRIEAARERVEQGYYSKSEVLEEVVNGLVKDMKVQFSSHTHN